MCRSVEEDKTTVLTIVEDR